MTGWFYALGGVGRLEVKLQRHDGRYTYAEKTLEVPDDGGKWRKVTFDLVPDTTDAAARFLIVASNGGKIWIDDAYLADEPTNALTNETAPVTTAAQGNPKPAIITSFANRCCSSS
jgi:hypothetical protein